MLRPYRVLDLANEDGILCGQLLADLGCDVIAIEPPEGNSARRRGPFAGDVADPERSLTWWAWARGKRSAVIDLAREDGRVELKRLARSADFLIESFAPGRMAALGLGYADLAALNPALIYVSISAFGQDGPKAHYAATDLIGLAAGASLYLSGEAGGRPLRVAIPQAGLHASADAAVGALLAHFAREQSGRGQHVDASMQHATTLATQFRALDGALGETPARRVSGGVFVKGAFLRTRHRSADGWVVLGPGFLPSTGHFMKRLLGWLAEEGYGDANWLDEDWGTFAGRIANGALPESAYEPVERALTAFFATKTSAELMEQSVKRRLLVAPVLDLGQIVSSPQLAARGFAVTLPSPLDGAPLAHPGAWAKLEETPLCIARRAPHIGEHTAEVSGETRGEPLSLREAAVPASAASAQGGAALPFAGLKVLDLFWVLAGPGATRVLADYGATVVHVESSKHIDTLRVIPPYQFANPHPEGAGGFQSANANKLGVTIDMHTREGRAVILDLVRWADVVTSSFAPGVLDHLGLAWETIHELNPRAILLESCLMGQTGPWRGFTGFGNLAASVTGYMTLAGEPGGTPSGPWAAYTDFIAVRYNTLALLAAIDEQRRTGRGQRVDQSQAESALQFAAPGVLDFHVNGRVLRARANDDELYFPHGVFACRGEDRWVAIAVRDDRDWRELCAELQRDDLISRRAERELVTRALGAWCAERDAAAIERALQARGVPAHEVLDTARLYECPQLHHRGHWIECEHSIYQTTFVESGRLKLSALEPLKPKAALHFGRDNERVLKGILGYGDDRIAELAAKGVLT
jgi:crotonobetainyl-CoA:carnitine CoA-transferase CaiB-like acyl-CoA transferase